MSPRDPVKNPITQEQAPQQRLDVETLIARVRRDGVSDDYLAANNLTLEESDGHEGVRVLRNLGADRASEHDDVTVSFAIDGSSPDRPIVIQEITGIAGINSADGISPEEMRIFREQNPELYAIFAARSVEVPVVYENEQGGRDPLTHSR